MTCTNCNIETEGIRLNGKTYCPECGNLLEDESVPAEILAAFSEPQESSAKEPAVELKEDPLEANYSPETYKINPPQPQRINAEESINTLGAELQALDLVEEKAHEQEIEQETRELVETLKAEEEVLESINKLPNSKFKIQKAERERINRNREGFIVIPKEPDPIEEPQLPIPTEMLVENEQEQVADGAEKFDVITSNESQWKKENPTKEPKVHETSAVGEEKPKQKIATTELTEENSNTTALTKPNAFFTDYLKNSVQNIQTATPQKTKRKKKKTNKKVIFTFVAAAILILAVIGILLYVNLYVLNPDVAIKNTRKNTEISFKYPSYIPEGYHLSSKTTGTKDSVYLSFEFVNDKNRQVEIIIKKQNTNEKLSELVKSKNQSFINFEEQGISYWYVGENTLIFADNLYVYQITASDKMAKEELVKIAEGVVIGNDISG